MRTAIILGRKHGAKALEMISGPSIQITEQLKSFKAFLIDKEHESFETVELWTSDGGRMKQRRLLKPTPEVHQPQPQQKKK